MNHSNNRRQIGGEAGHQAGFTLIEIMIVCAIVAILTMIALPSYNESINRANRSDARGALVMASQHMERLRTEAGTYTPGGAVPTLPADLLQSPRSGAARYTLSVTAATATTYTLSATPTGTMASDSCGNLTLDQTGLRAYTGSGGVDSKCLNR